MTNDVTKKQETNLTMSDTRPEWLGRGLSVDTKVPRLLLMQAVSDFVNQEKAKKGTIVRSTTAECVGGVGKNVPMIVLSYPNKEWIIEVKIGKRFEYKKIVPRTRANEDLEWNYWSDEDGNELAPGTKGAFEAHRVRCGSFYALLPSDMDRFIAEMDKVAKGGIPDLSVDVTPVQVRCRSFSYEASLNVENMLSRIAKFRCEPWQFIMELGVKEMENDDNKWYIFDFNLRQKGTPTPEKYRETAKAAFQFVQQNASKLVVDDVEDIDSAGKEEYSGDAL